MQYFAPCPRGLESVLGEELSSIGAKEILATDGGVGFSGGMETAYRANLESRIASRILWKVLDRPYSGEEDIYAAALSLPWENWFSPDQSIKVNLSATKSGLKSLDFATLRIKDAVCDRMRKACGKRPSVDTSSPDIRIHAYLTSNLFSLYIDTSGEALFKRGARQFSVDAPVRENLAAGILRLSGWTPDTPFLDPMCGSGTFLVEAARIALSIPPGAARSFAFEKLSNFDETLWKKVKEVAMSRVKPVTPLQIYGSDILGRAVETARANLAGAGLEGAVTLKQANFLELPPPADHGVLVTNPPYGVRIGEMDELAALYPLLGDTLKKKYSGWRAYFFTADMRLAKLIRLSASKRTPLYNGALECRLFEYRMVEGGMKRVR